MSVHDPVDETARQPMNALPHHCTEEGCWGHSEELPKSDDGRFEIRTTRDPNTGEIPELAGYFVYDLLYGRQMFHAVSSARCRAWVSGYDEGLRADSSWRERALSAGSVDDD